MTKLFKVLVASSAIVLAACDDPLSVDFPGRIPTEQLSDPTLAPVLVVSSLGDFECAYSNYTGGSSVHSDEYETANSNIPGANWGERSVTDALDDYAIGPCDNGSIFGIVRTMQTARYQSETVSDQLAAWTDAEVPNRASLQAQVRAYGAYTYLLMGETFCSVSFDGGAEEPKENALTIAATQFEEAIAFAQASGNTAMLNMARVGLARTKMNQKQWAAAAAAAALVPAGFLVNSTTGADNPRRWNKLYRNAVELGAYTVSTAYRDLAAADPRVLVIDSGHGAFNPGIRLWVNTKSTSNGSPIRLASYEEAQLILAEAQAEQGQLDAANATLNVSRTAAGLTPFPNGQTKDQVIANVIAERRAILSFEGGSRLNDLLRKGIPWKIGANPFTGRPYGGTTCWPMPVKEKQGA
jgi:hypothetical protein